MRQALLVVLLVVASCGLTFNDDLVYSCANDFDCGGDGYQCVNSLCCRATGPEVCGDGKDNDCDGRVDDVGCDEVVALQIPDAGACAKVPELDCRNGIDDDQDDSIDCADTDCANASCGIDCVCANRQKTETNCGDGIDNDGDGLRDCADVEDCPAGSSCVRPNSGRAGLCQAATKSCN